MIKEPLLKHVAPDDLAPTAYRAYEWASGREPKDWEGLSLEKQYPWQRLSRQVNAILTDCEGQSFSQIWRKMFEAAFGDDGTPQLTDWSALAWQAVTRHLWAIMDGDEIDDLAALEKSWRAWVEDRKGRK